MFTESLQSIKNEAQREKFQDAIAKCIGALGKRVTDPAEKLEAMMYLMDKIKVC